MMQCCKPEVKPLLHGLSKQVNFEDRAYAPETVAGIIDEYQDVLKELMLSVPGSNSNSLKLDIEEDEDHGWATAPPPADVPDTHVYYGYAPGQQMVIAVSTCFMKGIDADALFRLLVSVEGFIIIDPDTTNHKRPPVEVLSPHWRDRAEVTHAISKPALPFMWPRTFMVLNAMDHKQRLFTSVPVLHRDFPIEEDLKQKRARAHNVWASWCDPVQGGCILRSLCWLDMGGTFSKEQTDRIVAKVFMQAFHQRLHKAVQAKPELRLQPAAVELGTQQAAETAVVSTLDVMVESPTAAQAVKVAV